jgi:putative hydrolase of the HAD superfamily
VTKPRLLEGISVLSFDGDDTLWDFQTSMRGALGVVLEELRAIVPGNASASLTVEEMVRIREEVAGGLGGRISLEEIRVRAFIATLETLGVRDEALARDLNETYRLTRLGLVTPFPDVVPALDSLGSRFLMGLLTNGNTPAEAAGLGGRFAFQIFASEAGVEKPDPRIFEICLRAAGCLPDELLHVGDSARDDVEGAHGAGIRCAWIRRRPGVPNPKTAPDLEISSLEDLAGLLLPQSP